MQASADKMGTYLSILVIGIVLIAGVAVACVSPTLGLSNETVGTVVVSKSSSETTLTHTVGTVNVIFPGVQIVNRTFVAMAGVPVSIVFNVTAAQARTYYWAIFATDSQLSFLDMTPSFDATKVPLPQGISVQYPDGWSFVGNQSAVYARMTFTGVAVDQSGVSLKLGVFDPVQSAGGFFPFTVTVSPSPSTAWSASGVAERATLVGAVLVVVAVLVVFRRNHRLSGTPPMVGQP